MEGKSASEAGCCSLEASDAPARAVSSEPGTLMMPLSPKSDFFPRQSKGSKEEAGRGKAAKGDGRSAVNAMRRQNPSNENSFFGGGGGGVGGGGGGGGSWARESGVYYILYPEPTAGR